MQLSNGFLNILKAAANRAHLVPKQIEVTRKGKKFMRTVFVRPDDMPKKKRVGTEISSKKKVKEKIEKPEEEKTNTRLTDQQKEKVTKAIKNIKEKNSNSLIEKEGNRLEETKKKNIESFKELPANEIKTKVQYTKVEHYDRPVIDGIKNSILQNGFDPSRPITLDSDGFVVDGHHRFTAVQELIREKKLPEDTLIATVRKNYKSEADRVLDQVASNKMRRIVNPLDDAEAYKKLVDSGKSIQEISDHTGENPEKIRNTIALNNLIPEIKQLINSDHLSGRKKTSKKEEGTEEKQKSISLSVAMQIGRNAIKEDGTPNQTIQLKAFKYAQENKVTPSQVANYIKTLKDQSFNFGQIDNKGRSKVEQEALSKIEGGEDQAHAIASKGENFVKETQKVFSKIFGDSLGQVDPKILNEMTASIIASKGEGKAENFVNHLDILEKTIAMAKDIFKKKLGEIKADSTMDSFFAFGKSYIYDLIKFEKQLIEIRKSGLIRSIADELLKKLLDINNTPASKVIEKQKTEKDIAIRNAVRNRKNKVEIIDEDVQDKTVISNIEDSFASDESIDSKDLIINENEIIKDEIPLKRRKIIGSIVSCFHKSRIFQIIKARSHKYKFYILTGNKKNPRKYFYTMDEYKKYLRKVRATKKAVIDLETKNKIKEVEIHNEIKEAVKEQKPALTLTQETVTQKEKVSQSNHAQGSLFGKKPIENFTRKDFKPKFIPQKTDNTPGAIITSIKNVLLKEGLDTRASEFVDKAMKAKDINEVKSIASNYVDIPVLPVAEEPSDVVKETLKNSTGINIEYNGFNYEARKIGNVAIFKDHNGQNKITVIGMKDPNDLYKYNLPGAYNTSNQKFGDIVKLANYLKDKVSVDENGNLSDGSKQVFYNLKKNSNPLDPEETIKNINMLSETKLSPPVESITENNFETMPESPKTDISQLIQASNIHIAIDQLLKLNLSDPDRKFISRVKEVKYKIPQNITETIQNSIKSLPEKAVNKVIEILKKFVPNELAKHEEPLNPNALSEALKGNTNAEKLNKVDEQKPNIVTASNLSIVTDQLLKLDLSKEDRAYIERVKSIRTRIPNQIVEIIQNAIKSMDVKDKDFVIKTIRSYVSESLLNYAESSPELKESTNPVKNKVIATKLRKLAESLDSEIDRLQNSAIGQRRPTARRSSISGNMYERGEKVKKIQAALNGLSDLWERDEIPDELKAIKSKSDVEAILSRYNVKLMREESAKKNGRFDYADNLELPLLKSQDSKDIYKFLTGTGEPKVDYSGGLYDVNAKYLIKHGLLTKEELEDFQEIYDIISKANPDEYGVRTNDLSLIKKYNRVMDKFALIDRRNIKKDSVTGKPKYTKLSSKSYSRVEPGLLVMGITSTSDLVKAGKALNDLMIGKYSPQDPQAKKIKDAETALIGNKIPGFFPTPKKIIEEAIDRLDLKPGMKVLEPSAGKGDMADALRDAGAEVDTIEPNSALRNILELKGHNIVDHDLLDFKPRESYTYGDVFKAKDGKVGILRGAGGLGSDSVKLVDKDGKMIGYYKRSELEGIQKMGSDLYDRILMNPPFEKSQDAIHIQEAYKHLKPGGKLVAITGEGIFFRDNKTDRSFREWLESVNGESEKLPEGSFAGNDAFRNTGVATRIVAITKPDNFSTMPDSEPIKNVAIKETVKDFSTKKKIRNLKGKSIKPKQTAIEISKTINNATPETRAESTLELTGKNENEISIYEETEKEVSQKKIEIVERKFKTRSGKEIDALDHTQIELKDIQLADIDTILDKPKPYYIPEINEEAFKRSGYSFKYIKLDDKNYIVDLNGMEYSKITDSYKLSILQGNVKSNFAIMSLDNLVATTEYYRSKAKAKIKKDKETAIRKKIEYVKSWNEENIKNYYPFDYDKRLSEKQKKKYTFEQWNSLTDAEKAEEIPFMKYPPVKLPVGKKIKILPDDTITRQNFIMYKIFADKNYTEPAGRVYYENDPVAIEFDSARKKYAIKLNDMEIQKETDSQSYEKGFETSFGESNTSDKLKNSLGIMVKSQNGKEITSEQIIQIDEAMKNLYSIFGDRSSMARKSNLKISHSGERLIFARTAMGLYVPSKKTIAISAKFGKDIFGFTLVHEFAHYMDHYLGQIKGARYSSSDFSSDSFIIADKFRNQMKEGNKSSKYWKSTCECFARAFEQYSAIKQGNSSYNDQDFYCSDADFKEKIMPDIDRFLMNNNEILKTALFGRIKSNLIENIFDAWDEICERIG